jgi:hypothetical protein
MRCVTHSFPPAVTLSNDLNAVSIEPGNSPTVIRQHYWRKKRPDQANVWFEVTPEKAASLIPFNAELAAEV